MTDLPRLAASTPNLPCHTNPQRWYSRSAEDRAYAVAACQPCPLREACAEYAVQTREAHGVWGGTTAADRRQFWSGEPCRFDEQGRLRLLCGSERAYRSHFSYREQPCAVCVAAHEALVEETRRAQLVVEHAKGGTSRGYFTHRRLGEPPCAVCRAGQGREVQSKRQREREAGERARAEWDARKSADALRGAPGGAQPASCAA